MYIFELSRTRNFVEQYYTYIYSVRTREKRKHCFVIYFVLSAKIQSFRYSKLSNRFRKIVIYYYNGTANSTRIKIANIKLLTKTFLKFYRVKPLRLVRAKANAAMFRLV